MIHIQDDGDGKLKSIVILVTLMMTMMMMMP